MTTWALALTKNLEDINRYNGIEFDLVVFRLLIEISKLNTNLNLEIKKEEDLASICHEFNRDEKRKLIFELFATIYNCVYDSLIETNSIINGSQEQNKY